MPTSSPAANPAGILNNWDASDPARMEALVRSAVNQSVFGAHVADPWFLPSASGGETLVAAARMIGALRQGPHPEQRRRVLSEDGARELRLEAHSGEPCQCPITLACIAAGDDVSVLPCGHRFTPGAVHMWLKEYAAHCPICRAPLPSKADYDAGSSV